MTLNIGTIVVMLSATALFITIAISIVGVQIFTALALVFLPFFIKNKWYRWIYILYKTLPRDAKTVVKYIQVNVMLYKWEKSKMVLPRMWMTLVKKHPNKAVFYFEDTTWTYKDVDDFSNKIASYFKKEGFKKGDSVSLFMESRPEYLATWLGMSKLGVVTALINTNLIKYPLIHSIKTANTKGLIFSCELKNVVNDVRSELSDLKLYQFNVPNDETAQILSDSIDLRDKLKGSENVVPWDDMKTIEQKDKLLYVYTSGTTGLPKAAVITNIRYMFMVCASYYLLGLKEDDIIYDSLPLYHSAGGIVGAGQGMLFGIPIVIRKKFSASNFWKDCNKYNCTVAQYIGEICRYLLAVPSDPSETQHKLRKMFGNGLRPAIWKPFAERFAVKDIVEFYGATEGNSNIVNFDGVPGAVGFKPRYIGDIYPIALIRYDEQTMEPIRDENGRCISCKIEEPGIFIGKITRRKAINDFEGYTDKTATKKKVLTDVFKNGDCYFNSGDILVQDELGYFYFKDRTGDTFRWKGENVSTAEVEGVISNIVELNDAVVYGVEVPNTEGKCGMAAIVDSENNLKLDELVKGLKHNLPSYSCPLFLRVMKEAPVTGTFKLKKVDLQQDGYDPNKIKDKLYFLDAKLGKFVNLDQNLFDNIQNGTIRL